MASENGFHDFVVTNQRMLLRSAWLLERDWYEAEDLVQLALTQAWRRWELVAAADSPQAYVQRILVASFLKRRRRARIFDPPLPGGRSPAEPGVGDGQERSAARADLHRAVARLPKRQRAAVVLRYFLDLSEAETAKTMGCSVGTVKSHCSRAIKALRDDGGLRITNGEPVSP
jgi:RNA polymerase sigma-70 factor (sigma-E family)